MSNHYRAMADADVEVKGRTVAGLLVPWDSAVRVNDRLVEGFRSGAFDKQMDRPFRVPFARGHLGSNGTMGGQAVGRMTMLRNDASGLYGEAKVSETPAGDELLTLIRDGVFEALSIGFRDLAPNAPDRQGIQWRTNAQLTELATVVTPAYPGAQVLEVRAEICPTCGAEKDNPLLGDVVNPTVAEMVEEQRALQAQLIAEWHSGLRRPGS